MKTLKEYQDYLFANGYEISEGLPYGFFGDELTSVEYRNKKNKKYVLLNCYYTDELISFLEKNYEEGEEFTIDDKMMEMIEVNSATIECSIVNVPHFMDGTKPGIFLQEGGDGGVMDFSDYYKDRMDLFEKCIWIQNNELEHSKNILEQHFKNIEFFNENIKPILDNYGYYLGTVPSLTSRRRTHPVHCLSIGSLKHMIVIASLLRQTVSPGNCLVSSHLETMMRVGRSLKIW